MRDYTLLALALAAKLLLVAFVVTSCGVREQDLYKGVCYVEGTTCRK